MVDQQVWKWHQGLDTLITAPEYHLPLFENEAVRALSWSDFARRDGEGRIIVDSSAISPRRVRCGQGRFRRTHLRM